jgi:hypothetical protein
MAIAVRRDDQALAVVGELNLRPLAPLSAGKPLLEFE